MIVPMIKGGCHVGFFGLGKSNLALLSNLPLHKCKITLRSDNKIAEDEIPDNVKIDRLLCEENCLDDISEDIIFFSPSVRRDRHELLEAKKQGVMFSSDAELFFESNKLPVYAVTGSDGKSTTATLVHLLLRESGIKSDLVGNVGKPMISALDKDEGVIVCELSSFMLNYYAPKSVAACITNITANHLDWHINFSEYVKSKIEITKNTDRLVLSDENQGLQKAYAIVSTERSYKELVKRDKDVVYFTIEEGFICRGGIKMIPISEVKCKELHNLKNLLMAIAMTDGTATNEAILSVAKSFQGLEHRCQHIANIQNVDCIDSSIDSTPARTVQTLFSLNRRVSIILGGKGKGLDYSELVPALKKYASCVVITGENSQDIFSAIEKHLPSLVIADFDLAVKVAFENAKNTGTLLLSPASTSFDKFKNYAERGNKFKEILAKYAENENISLQNIEETRKNGETNLS